MWEFDRRLDTIVLEHLASTTCRTPISLMVAAIVLSALLPPSANATARFRAFLLGAKLVAAGRTAQLHGTEAYFHPEGLPSVLLCPVFVAVLPDRVHSGEPSSTSCCRSESSGSSLCGLPLRVPRVPAAVLSIYWSSSVGKVRCFWHFWSTGPQPGIAR